MTENLRPDPKDATPVPETACTSRRHGGRNVRLLHHRLDVYPLNLQQGNVTSCETTDKSAVATVRAQPVAFREKPSALAEPLGAPGPQPQREPEGTPPSSGRHVENSCDRHRILPTAEDRLTKAGRIGRDAEEGGPHALLIEFILRAASHVLPPA